MLATAGLAAAPVIGTAEEIGAWQKRAEREAEAALLLLKLQKPLPRRGRRRRLGRRGTC